MRNAYLTAASFAADSTKGPIKLEQPWTRATPGGAAVAGGFVRITNSGTSADRLVGGTLEGAGRVEVHEMTMDAGIMKMRRLSQGLEIKPGETVDLKPGSYHVMFMELKSPIVEGAPVKGTLAFENAGPIDVEYAVAPIGAKTLPGKLD